MKNTEKTMDKIVALCKNRGFVFPGSEIYGGLANTWDYGPLGAELKKNIKNAWWKKFVQENPYNVGLDAAILMNPQTWVASGHLGGFSDPLMDCRECHERFRADKVIEDWCAETGFELPKPIDAFSQQEMKDFVEEHNIPCPTCGKHNFTDIRQFNLMFKTFQGVTEDAKNTVYLRPETAQGIFVNFNNVQRTTRKKLPFGIGQIGKSFRNEITPGNFIFRVREFEQMELEFFCKPGTDLEWFNYWRTFCHNWLLSIGLKDENLRLRDHDPEELCFYSKATTDFEFLFPFGWGELWGVADRTDYDLTQHQNTSGVKMVYREGEGKDMVEYVPYVIEPSLGVERSVLAVLCDAYDEEVVGQDKKGNDDVRVVLHFHPALAPFKAAILPLSKKDVLAGPAMELYNELSKEFMVDYDETGSIGKAYGYQLGVKHQYPEGEFDQVDRVLYDLKHNPASRRILTNIYTFEDLHEMALYPCAYSMTFNVSGNTLNAILNQRSQDMLAANNWNVVQYAVLLALLAAVLTGERPELDMQRVVLMCLIHDIVEIDAGDTYAYDAEGLKTQKAREDAAKERIFSLLPDEQKEELTALFDEFEAYETPESKFAHSMDNLQPLLLNNSNGGGDWREHGVTAEQVYGRQSKTRLGSEQLFEVVDRIIRENIEKGNISN